MKKTCLFVFFIASLFHISFAQNYDYGFTRDFGLVVRDSSLSPLPMAWVGGLNSCHFNEIDLNLDGIKDLVVFDKTGDRLLTFINGGTPDSVDYTYAPKYEAYFPGISGWIQLRDYNCDGREDLFAYTTAGIQVWRNVSDTTIKFIQVTHLLDSWQGAGFSNIALTYADFPAIEDIDGDGDLDILVFFQLGAYVQMHKNLSMEQFGDCDTLLYRNTLNCWGNFAESATTNHIYLNIVCPWKCHELPEAGTEGDEKGSKHTGSTMLLYDATGDSVKDMVIGDVDFMNLILLTNGGDQDSAYMISEDTLFPSNTVPVDLVSFPAACYIDVNNDGRKDLLVSPFDANPLIPESFKSIWYYEDTGTSNLPVFQYRANNFFQSQMIDVGTGAWPVFFDQNADGLQDLVIGNYGYLDSTYYQLGFLHSEFRSSLALYRNTGTSVNPEFTIVSRDFADLSALGLKGLYPAFGDMDNDGDMDMICGESTGKLYYFTNTAGQGNPASYTLTQANYQGIDVGDYSAPTVLDLDGDSLLDLVIGKKNGMLSWYRNTGTPVNAVFTLMTDSLGQVNVTNYNYSYSGYSTPCFIRDTSGLLKLFVGSEQGNFYYFKDIEGNLLGQFTPGDSMLIYSDEDSVSHFIVAGLRSGPAVSDLDHDGYPDLIAGNFAGGLHCYKGVHAHPMAMPEWGSRQEDRYRVFPNPASDRLWIIPDNLYPDLTAVLHLSGVSGKNIRNYGLRTSGASSINIADIPAGIYIFRIETSGNDDVYRQTGKLVIVR